VEIVASDSMGWHMNIMLTISCDEATSSSLYEQTSNTAPL